MVYELKCMCQTESNSLYHISLNYAFKLHMVISSVKMCNY
jgi:hypothetical protein